MVKSKLNLDEIKRISKLSKEQQIKELQRLKKEQQKELNEIDDLLNKSIIDKQSEEREKVIEEIETSNSGIDSLVEKKLENIEDEIKDIKGEALISSPNYQSALNQLQDSLQYENKNLYAIGNQGIYSILSNLQTQSQDGQQWSEQDQQAFGMIKETLMNTELDYSGETPEEVLDSIVASRSVLKQLGYKADWWKT